MSWPDSVTRPSKWLDDLLRGKIEWEDAPESIRSWASKEIFDAAKTILTRGKTKEDRRKMLAKIPEKIRPKVEAEILRLWKAPQNRPNPVKPAP